MHLLLGPGDTVYVGTHNDDGEYVEARVSNTNGHMLITTSDGNTVK